MTRWLWSVSLGALGLSPARAAAPAAEGYVKIIAPADGTRLEGAMNVKAIVAAAQAVANPNASSNGRRAAGGEQ